MTGLKSIVGAVLLLVSSAQFATALTFTNVSYTDSSVTFTVDGTVGPQTVDNILTNQFSLLYEGDIFSDIGASFSANVWSDSVFDNRSLQSAGNTGAFGRERPYSWSRYNTSLAGASVDNKTVTVSFRAGMLNTNATNAQISFAWGNGHADSSVQIFQTVNLSNTVAPIPLPAGLPLLGFAIAGLSGAAWAKRRRRAA